MLMVVIFQDGVTAVFYSCFHAFYIRIFLDEKILPIYIFKFIEFEWKYVFKFVLLIKPLSSLALCHWLRYHSYSSQGFF